MKQTRTFAVIALLLVSLISNAVPVASGMDSFENIELMQANGDNLRETSVRIVFDEAVMRVVSRSNGAVMKEWSYDKIKSAEYSYTKNPRWKTGLGLGAASVLFPPLLLIAIPVCVAWVSWGARNLFIKVIGLVFSVLLTGAAAFLIMLGREGARGWF